MRESELGFGTVSLRFETGVNLFLWLVEASERPLAKRRAFIAHGKKNSRRVRCCIPEGLFRLKFQHLASLCPKREETVSVPFFPCSRTRPPATHVAAILFVVCPEFLSQRRLLIKHDEQMHADGDG